MNKFKREIWAKRQVLHEGNKLYGAALQEVPRLSWARAFGVATEVFKTDTNILRVFRSRDFLVSVFQERGYHRLSICRTAIDNDGNWKADIGWEELQRLKNEAGYDHCDAVEIYPRFGDEVNVANMRHLWVDPANPILPYPWRRQHADRHEA